MNDEINVEAVAAQVATELSKDFLKATAGLLTSVPRNIYERYFPNFEAHLSEMYKRNFCVRTLFSKDKSIEFSSIYVESKFTSENELVADSEIIEAVKENKRCIISANGGAGKTFLMRHLWLETFANPQGRVPLFIELRSVNSLSSPDLEAYIRASAFGPDGMTADNFKTFARKGLFVFILDGFDEIVRDKREGLERQIVDAAAAYPDCGFIVSGRPDERFGSWQSFQTYRAEPFSYEQFQELVKKVPFDEKTKKSFLKVSDNSFFLKHQSFLSNPLLAIMMLMTYRDNAEIPSRLNTFYENCFNTLYSKHDALKDGNFFRKKHLDQDSFRRVFSVFCLFTYIKNRFSLEENEFRHFVEKSAKYLSLGESVDQISEDFLISVNLIVFEGTAYSFIHRSFQEYFAAFCATSIMVERTEEILGLFASKRNDSTFKLAHEIHPSLVQEKYLLPNFRKMLDEKRIVEKVNKKSPFLALCKSGVSINWSTKMVKVSSDGEGLDKEMFFLTYRGGFENEFSEFLNASAAALGIENIVDEIYSEFTEILNILMSLFNKEQFQFGIADGVEIEFSAIFDVDKPKLALSFSRDYKNLPSGTNEVRAELLSELSKFGQKMNDKLVALMKQVGSGLREIDSEFDHRQKSIEDFFDL